MYAVRSRAYSLNMLYRHHRTLYSSFCPITSIQIPIPYGFGDMLALDVFAAFEVGDGASYLQDAAVGACREAQLLHGHAKHLKALRIRFCELMEHLVGHLGVAVDAACSRRERTEARLLDLPCLNDPFADDGRRFTWCQLG